jgi:hypothetical protein
MEYPVVRVRLLHIVRAGHHLVRSTDGGVNPPTGVDAALAERNH